LWGKREQAAQWLRNVVEFEQGQNRYCQHRMTGKLSSQHHHKKMELHRFVLL